jgi:non-lysosomal glucosylceramidase
LQYLKTFDLDNDGIPKIPTHQAKPLMIGVCRGFSAYCGGLWIAALEAAAT